MSTTLTTRFSPDHARSRLRRASAAPAGATAAVLLALSLFAAAAQAADPAPPASTPSPTGTQQTTTPPPAPPDPAAILAVQRAAAAKLAMLDGEWRGTATVMLPDGSTRTMVHTERVGTLQDGAIRLIEGRSYDDAGQPQFAAFAVVSWDAMRNQFRFRSHAQGFYGDYPLTVTADGFSWEMQAGPMRMRYTARIADGRWEETGVREMPGQPPVTFITMTMQRIGDSAWPGAGAVPPQAAGGAR